MKKINKSLPPNALTQYAANYPHNKWDKGGFRDHNSGNDYQDIRLLSITDQGGLCAYCEVEIQNKFAHQQRVEHIHSK